MNWTRIAAMLAALVAFTPAMPLQGAIAQPDPRKCANTEFAARSQPLGEFGPFAGASFKAEDYHDVDGPRCRIITFYRVPPKVPGATGAEIRRNLKDLAGKGSAPVFVARYVDDSRAAAFVSRWTDQAKCPALVPALDKLEPILAPKVIGDGPYRGMEVSGDDGPNVRFWMNGQVYPQPNADYTLNYALDGAHGSAFGQWLDETFKELDGCWSTDAPVIP